jgi:GNAT superfamily N-acetyltransferase
MTVTIRPARPEDDGAFVEMFLALNRFEEPMTHDRRTDYEAAVENLGAARARVEKKEGLIFAAEQAGRVVGMLFMIFADYDVYVREALRRYAMITDLFVHADARRKGVAAALIAQAERAAGARGVKRIAIGVLAGNAPADRLYARLGFETSYVERVKPVSPCP